MRNSKVNKRLSELDFLLGEASFLLSHAQALEDYGRKEEAFAELAKAAAYEEEVAYFLDAAGREQEGVFHRVSAATCHEKVGNYPQAVTLLWAALAGKITEEYRREVQLSLERCIAQAQSLSIPSARRTRKRAAAPLPVWQWKLNAKL
jgi:tetratricopeptide (TPR) repeat protein